MRKMITSLALVAALIAPPVLAQGDYSDDGAGDASASSDSSSEGYSSDENQQAGQAGEATDSAAEAESQYETDEFYTPDTADVPGEAGEAGSEGQTIAGASEKDRYALRDETVGIRPQVGALVFNDVNNEQTARAAAGLTLDFNLAELFDKNWGNLFIGPSTGIIYSHLGAPGSNFFGSSGDDNQAGGNSNFFYVPLNGKLGVTLGNNFRISAHGGANAVYRNNASGISLGGSDNNVNIGDSTFTLYPNIGADLEVGMGSSLALTLRPDYTITPGDDFFTGTVALAIPLG